LRRAFSFHLQVSRFDNSRFSKVSIYFEAMAGMKRTKICRGDEKTHKKYAKIQ